MLCLYLRKVSLKILILELSLKFHPLISRKLEKTSSTIQTKIHWIGLNKYGDFTTKYVIEGRKVD